MLSSNARPLQIPSWTRRIYSISLYTLKIYFNAFPCAYVFQKAYILQIYVTQIWKYGSHLKCVPYFSYNKICCGYQFSITWIKSLDSPYEIGGKQRGQKKGFYRNISASLVSMVMPMLHSHLLSYHGTHVILTHCSRTFWARPVRKIKLPAVARASRGPSDLHGKWSCLWHKKTDVEITQFNDKAEIQNLKTNFLGQNFVILLI